MNIYNNYDSISETLNLDDIIIDEFDIDEYADEFQGSRWNNCKAHSISVSIGMTNWHKSEEARDIRKSNAEAMRGNQACAVAGNTGNTHSEETKRAIAKKSGRRMTEDDKKTVLRLYYEELVGTKLIAKQIGFSQTAIRKLIKSVGKCTQNPM
jgi:DNA-directed RNA polymerase specialized sigma subunit